MKRGRVSSFSETRIEPGPSRTDLPSAMIVEIVLRMPAKGIVMCKSVCKAWYGLISEPGFAKLHLERAKSCALIRGVDCRKFSRSLYLMEPGDDGGSGLDSGYCCCRARNERCGRCRFNAEIKLKLKVPLRNVQVMLDRAGGGSSMDTDVMFCLSTTKKSRHLIKLKSRDDHGYDLANSSNGFICLYASSINHGKTHESVCICNPITGEFAYLPQSCIHGISEFGFGFSPKHNQYKVIRKSHYWRNNLAMGFRGFSATVVEIHTIGTNSWRSLDISGFETPSIMWPPAYHKGALYWVGVGKNRNCFLASFDLDDEQFHVHSSSIRQTSCLELGIAVLESRLFVYTSHAYDHVHIWLVNECDISLSVTQLFEIDLTELRVPCNWSDYRLVHCINNEAVVLFGGPRQEFVYYDRSQGLRFRQPKFRGVQTHFDVMTFTPSFVSLKDAVIPGSDIEVLNVNSGCGKLKLLEETYPLLLGKSRN